MNKHNSLPDRSALEKEYTINYSYLEKILNGITNKLRPLFAGEMMSISIKFRVKTFDSYFNKLMFRLKKGVSDNPYKITDILGIRIICPFIDDTSKVQDIIKSNFDVIESEKKGFHHTFREFGYEATHLIIRIEHGGNKTDSILIPEGCEIQISTTLQDAWAEVEHELVYKAPLTPYDTPLKRKLAAINATLTLSDIIFQEIRDYHRSIQHYTVKRRDNLNKKIIETEISQSEMPVDSGITDINTLVHGNELNNNDTIDSVLLKALNAHDKGDYETSIKLYTHLLSLENNQHIRSVILNHRGLAFMAGSDYSNAIEDFLEAVDINPENYHSYNSIAICKRMLGDYDAALEYLELSTKINPYHAENYYSRAVIYYDIGDYYRAYDQCEKALNFKPDNEIFNKFHKIIYSKIYKQQ